MPRLIDADALKKEWKMGDVCETCDQDTRQCGNDYCFSRMDVCSMIDDAPTVATDTNVLNKWISVKDRLPEHSKKYLIYATSGDNKVGYITTATFGGHFVLTGRRAYWKVTHWMPLPEPPKEVTQDGVR